MIPARAFSSRLAYLLRNERLAMAEFLLALADFDSKRVWVELGYTSLFHYLQRELGLSNGPAFYRMTAAHLIQEYPEIVEPLRDGRLCLTTVAEISRVLTRENVSAVLPRFFGASKQEAKEVAAEVCPQTIWNRTVVTSVGTPAAATKVCQPSNGPADPVPAIEGIAALLPLLPEEVRPEAPRTRDDARALVEPKTPELSRMHITVTRRLVEKLAAARDALSHSRPNASDDEIIEAGLDLIVAGAAKRHGLTERPRKTPPSSNGDGIPAHVKRAVWERDGGHCTFPLANGELCGSTRKLEYDHIIPESLGGKATVENTRLRCKFHNLVEARRVLGDGVMDRYTSIGRGP